MTKKEQLRKVFKVILKDLLDKLGGSFSVDGDIEKIVVRETTDLLLTEVTKSKVQT